MKVILTKWRTSRKKSNKPQKDLKETRLRASKGHLSLRRNNEKKLKKNKLNLMGSNWVRIN